MELNKQVRLFNEDAPNLAETILDEHSGILYWDEQNPAYYNVYHELVGNFWHAHEVSLKQDSADWHSRMSEEEKDFFKRGISQLVVLDSVATVADGMFSAYIKNPAIKAIMAYIGSQEAIHNETYTYITTTFMSREESQKVFETPKTDEHIKEANKIILDVFEDFAKNPTPETLVRGLVAMAMLEGIRFTNGFTPFYLLARNKRMKNSSTLITYIQRDETQHSYFQTLVVRQLLTEFPELNNEELTKWIYKSFRDVVAKEKELSLSMYKDGFLGIDMVELEMYIEWRANLILKNLGLTEIFETKSNPMRWIKGFDSESINNKKVDFFEGRVDNYTKVTGRFDDL